MTTPDKILYEAEMTASGGRDGRAVSPDGSFSLDLSVPKGLGGPGGDGTNPEQLFAAGYAACFLGALKLVARQGNVALPADTTITAKVGIGPVATGYGLAVGLTATLPGIDRAAAEDLMEKAHQRCPYSNATRGNVPVTLSVG
ncbi:organic hydroperoxide resistance protein [Mangrovibrevibacter kandeliae]|uniref:organic hydroperoxide resistance protein n=1 Tax=Mangrovibrevibacter kandeliae TaxID=2968473 RepID=UPI002119B50E|nr:MULTISPECIES: organic hydroperoxide resistance protein [unclassified Aurantimonas]MCQ8782128.1 organic hydroperoxide resistance protein [Aurantimonas sp. CSK15Z-1]MCW4115213.1 organic hydroperoxide resistance protein [Aurantimonas sp. MSK8Z-1]